MPAFTISHVNMGLFTHAHTVPAAPGRPDGGNERRPARRAASVPREFEHRQELGTASSSLTECALGSANFPEKSNELEAVDY